MAQVLFRYLCVTKGSSLVRPPHAFVVIKKTLSYSKSIYLSTLNHKQPHKPGKMASSRAYASLGITSAIPGWWLWMSLHSSMTRATRRTTRNSTSQLLGSDAAASSPPGAVTDIVDPQEDLCPSCSVSLSRDIKDEDSESWVRCDFCKTWYHWRCVGENGKLDTIDKWFVPLLDPFSCCLTRF
jgi:hypothetical protein